MTMGSRVALVAGSIVLLAVVAVIGQRNSNQEIIFVGATYPHLPLSIDSVSSIAAGDDVSQSTDNMYLHPTLVSFQPFPSQFQTRGTMSESETTSAKVKETNELILITAQEVRAIDTFNQWSRLVVATRSSDHITKTSIHSSEPRIGSKVMMTEPRMPSEIVVKPSMSRGEITIEPEMTQFISPTPEVSITHSTLLPDMTGQLPHQALVGHDNPTVKPVKVTENNLLISPSPVQRKGTTRGPLIKDNIATVTETFLGNDPISSPVHLPQSTLKTVLPQGNSVPELFEIASNLHQIISYVYNAGTFPITTHVDQYSFGFSPSTELTKPSPTVTTLAAVSQPFFTSSAVIYSVELEPTGRHEFSPTSTNLDRESIDLVSTNSEIHTPLPSVFLDHYSGRLAQFDTAVQTLSDAYGSVPPVQSSEPTYLQQTMTTTELVVHSSHYHASSHEPQVSKVASTRSDPVNTIIQGHVRLMETQTQELLTANPSPPTLGFSYSPASGTYLQDTTVSVDMLATPFTHPTVQPTLTQDIQLQLNSGILLISPSPVVRQSIIRSSKQLPDLILPTSHPTYTSMLQSQEETSYIPMLSGPVTHDSSFLFTPSNFIHYEITLSPTMYQHLSGVSFPTRPSSLTSGSGTQHQFPFPNTRIIATGIHFTLVVPSATPEPSSALSRDWESIIVWKMSSTTLVKGSMITEALEIHTPPGSMLISSSAIMDTSFQTNGFYGSFELTRTNTAEVLPITSSYQAQPLNMTSIFLHVQRTIFPMKSSVQLLIHPTSSKASSSLPMTTNLKVSASFAGISAQTLTATPFEEKQPTSIGDYMKTALTHIVTSSPVGKVPSSATYNTMSIQPTTIEAVQSISNVIGRSIMGVSPSEATKTTLSPVPSRVLSSPTTIKTVVKTTTAKLSPTPTAIASQLMNDYTSVNDSMTDVSMYLITSPHVEKLTSLVSSFIISVPPTTASSSSIKPASTRIASKMSKNKSTFVEIIGVTKPIASSSQEKMSSPLERLIMMPQSVSSLQLLATKMTVTPLPSRVLPSLPSTLVDTNAGFVEFTIAELRSTPSDIPPKEMNSYSSIGDFITTISAPVEKLLGSLLSFTVMVQSSSKSVGTELITRVTAKKTESTKDFPIISPSSLADIMASSLTGLHSRVLSSPPSTLVDPSSGSASMVVKLSPTPSEFLPQLLDTNTDSSTTVFMTSEELQSSASSFRVTLHPTIAANSSVQDMSTVSTREMKNSFGVVIPSSQDVSSTVKQNNLRHLPQSATLDLTASLTARSSSHFKLSLGTMSKNMLSPSGIRNIIVQMSKTVTSLRIQQSGEGRVSISSTNDIITTTTMPSPTTAPPLISKVSITPTASPRHPFHEFIPPPDSIVSIVLAITPSKLSKMREVGSAEREQLLEALISVYERGSTAKEVVTRRSVREKVKGQVNTNEKSDIYKRQVLPEPEYTAVITDIKDVGDNAVDVRFFILDISNPSSPLPLNSTAVSEAYALSNFTEISGFTVVRKAQPTEDVQSEDAPPPEETGLSSRVTVGVVVAAAVLLTLVVIVLLIALRVIWRKRHKRKIRLQVSPERNQISLMSRTLVPTTSFEYEFQQPIVHQHRPGPSSNMAFSSSQEHLELASNSSEEPEAQSVITITHLAQSHYWNDVNESRPESREQVVTTLTQLARSWYS